MTGDAPIVPAAAAATPTIIERAVKAANDATVSQGAAAPNGAAAAAKGAAGANGSPPGTGAGHALGDMAGKISEGKKPGAANPEVDDALLRRRYDDEAMAAGIPPAVTGEFKTQLAMRDAMIAVANKSVRSTPASVPGLYLGIIDFVTQQMKLPPELSKRHVEYVRNSARAVAKQTLDALVLNAYSAAVYGNASDKDIQLKAFDQWEKLLGTEEKRFITNLAALKNDIESGGRTSVPRGVRFVEDGGGYRAEIPGAALRGLPAFAKLFALRREDLAPDFFQAAALREFQTAPGMFSRARVAYHYARNEMRRSMPGAVAAATEFWLRSVIEYLHRLILSFLFMTKPYDFSLKNAQVAAARDIRLMETAAAETSMALRAAGRASGVTVARYRNGLSALERAAAALNDLQNDDAGLRSVAALKGAFEAAVKNGALQPSDEIPVQDWVSGPNGIARLADRIQTEATQALDRRFWDAHGGSEFLDLGSGQGLGGSLARRIRERAGSSARSFVIRGDFLTVSGRAPGSGRVVMSVLLRPTRLGGRINMQLPKASDSFRREIEDWGVTTAAGGEGIRAAFSGSNGSIDAEQMSLLAETIYLKALGAQTNAAAQVRGGVLAEYDFGDREKALARDIDLMQLAAGGRRLGERGRYEIRGPLPVSSNGRLIRIYTLTDRDTGVVAYAVEASKIQSLMLKR